jgi:putative ABC transport system permease protein
MPLGILVLAALRNLRRTPLRTTLTMLGIVIGVGSVIAMITVGNGAKARVEEAILRLNGNLISLMSIASVDPYQSPTLAESDQLEISDYLALRNEVTGTTGVSPLHQKNGVKASANGKSSDAILLGVDVDAERILKRKLLAGTYFGPQDVTASSSVCLVAESLAERLFPATAAIGRRVRLNDVPFKVIGVISDAELPPPASPLPDGDTTIILPYTSMRQRIDRGALTLILFTAASPMELPSLKLDILSAIEARRGTRKSEFKAVAVVDTVQAYTEQTKAMTILLSAVGAISLIVGGIGIANIMLVSVSERTREIGLRLAVGTHRRDLLKLFLIEALIISLAGGVLGVIVGIFAGAAIAYSNDWQLRITITSIFIAFICSTAIGVIFGFHPARRASRLQPIEALRAE